MGGFAEKTGKPTVERAVRKPQPEPLVVLSMREHSTANQAGGCTANAAYPWKLALAVAATIKKTTCNAAAPQRQFVAGALAFQAQIPTGPMPFRTVRSDSMTPGPELGQQMSQFVTQGAVNLGWAEALKRRIEGYE
jgi:hypothetical protein